MKHLHAFTSHRERCRRYFATYRINGDDRRRIEASLEISTPKKSDSVGFRIHLGNRGSETPVDGMLDLNRIKVFWGLDFPGLGRICEVIGRGHKRDLSLQIHNHQLWWRLWYDDDGGMDPYHECDSWRRPKLWPWSAGRKKHRPWMCLRSGNIELNPVDAFYGHRLWLKDDTFDAPPTARALVSIGDFPGDEYAVDFTLERREVRRRTGPAWAGRVTRVDYSVDARCKPGIPVRNHDWKGDEILGWHENVTPDSVRDGSWVAEAVTRTIAHVRRDRQHHGYVPPAAAREASDG